MSVTLALLVGILVAVGCYLVLHRTLTRIILGIGLLTNGANLLVLATGGPAGDAPIMGLGENRADALSQAFVLTSIVLGFAITAFMLALAWRSWTIDGVDDVEDDIEDRRIAKEERRAERQAEQDAEADA
jgi:multicomponent Na+:H+ antiporter subunit C